MNDSSLDDALTRDHVLLDGLFAKARAFLLQQDRAGAGAWEEFGRRLLRHMTWEETALFPALRASVRHYPERKIESLVIDHARIREQLEELAVLLRGSRGVPAEQALDQLWIYLEGHNRDEEKGVYSDADRSLSESDRRRLLAEWIAGSE